MLSRSVLTLVLGASAALGAVQTSYLLRVLWSVASWSQSLVVLNSYQLFSGSDYPSSSFEAYGLRQGKEERVDGAKVHDSRLQVVTPFLRYLFPLEMGHRWNWFVLWRLLLCVLRQRHIPGEQARGLSGCQGLLCKGENLHLFSCLSSEQQRWNTPRRCSWCFFLMSFSTGWHLHWPR